MDKTYQQNYLHCPNCGKLDRQFGELVEGKLFFCQECHTPSSRKLWITPMEGRDWLAQNISGEISIVRRDNLHGRISMGWFGDDKILILKTNDDTDEGIIDVALSAARRAADKRNKEESNSS